MSPWAEMSAMRAERRGRPPAEGAAAVLLPEKKGDRAGAGSVASAEAGAHAAVPTNASATSA